MSLENLVAAYGYPALFAGVALEGEGTVLIGGFLAHRGYLDLPVVFAVAFVATVLADQGFFFLGRWKGSSLLDRMPRLKPQADKVHALLADHGNLLVPGFRFLYGLRTATPIVIGMSGFSPRRFLFLNLAGAAAWCLTFTSAGYFFGATLEAALKDVKRYEVPVVVAIGCIAAILWGARRWSARRG